MSRLVWLVRCFRAFLTGVVEARAEIVTYYRDYRLARAHAVGMRFVQRVLP